MKESAKKSVSKTPKKEVETRSLRSRSKTQVLDKKSEKPKSVEKKLSRSKSIPKEVAEKKSVKLEPRSVRSKSKESKPPSVLKTALVSVKSVDKKKDSFDFKSKSHNASKRASAKPTPIPHHRSKTPLRSSTAKQQLVINEKA